MFIFGVVGVAFVLISIVWVHNECQVISRNIDFQMTDLSTHENDLSFLESQVKTLSSPNRIKRIAQLQFGLYQPVPEALVILLDDK